MFVLSVLKPHSVSLVSLSFLCMRLSNIHIHTHSLSKSGIYGNNTAQTKRPFYILLERLVFFFVPFLWNFFFFFFYSSETFFFFFRSFSVEFFFFFFYSSCLIWVAFKVPTCLNRKENLLFPSHMFIQFWFCFYFSFFEKKQKKVFIGFFSFKHPNFHQLVVG